MAKLDWIKPTKNEINDECIYSLDDIKRDFEVVPILENDGGFLVLKDEDGLTVSFAVMEYFCGSDNGKNIMLNCLFHGTGPSGSLRECRHTWWGEDGDGYVFYPNGPLICAAFKELSKLFDDLV